MDAVTGHDGHAAGDPGDAWRGGEPTSLEALLGAGKRVVICAPHPDDEVLGCGGLIAMCAERGIPVVVVSITDGEACYPDDATWTRPALRAARRIELERALACLGLPARAVRRLAIPDGEVAAGIDRIVDALLRLLQPDDVVFATAAFDGHPDHEATCTAARRAADTRGATLVEYPIWAGAFTPVPPGSMAVRRRVRLALTDAAVDAKRAALACFETQLGTATPAVEAPILPPAVLQRFLRRDETFFHATLLFHATVSHATRTAE